MSVATIVAIVFNTIMCVVSALMFFVHRKKEPWKSEPRKWRTIITITDVALTLGFTSAVVSNLSTGNEPLHTISSLAVIIVLGIGLALQLTIIIHYYRLGKKYQRETEELHAQTFATMMETIALLEQTVARNKQATGEPGEPETPQEELTDTAEKTEDGSK